MELQARTERVQALRKALSERLLVLDSAKGTYLQGVELSARILVVKPLKAATSTWC